MKMSTINLKVNFRKMGLVITPSGKEFPVIGGRVYTPVHRGNIPPEYGGKYNWSSRLQLQCLVPAPNGGWTKHWVDPKIQWVRKDPNDWGVGIPTLLREGLVNLIFRIRLTQKYLKGVRDKTRIPREKKWEVYAELR